MLDLIAKFLMGLGVQKAADESRSRARALAAELQDVEDLECREFPEGPDGERIYVISGVCAGVAFTLTARRFGHSTGLLMSDAATQLRMQGVDLSSEHRTDLEFEKPIEVSWAMIQADLRESMGGVAAARQVIEDAATITLSYAGSGRRAEFIRTLLREVAASIARRMGEAPPPG